MATSVLNARTSESERSLLERASVEAHIDLCDFVRRKALEATEIAVLECRTVVIPPKIGRRSKLGHIGRLDGSPGWQSCRNCGVNDQNALAAPECRTVSPMRY